MTTIFRQLPEDLVEEILSHVPATHLKRLRSTCKRWNLLFDDRRFATKHSDRAAKEFMTLLLTMDSRICPVRLNLHGIVPSLEVKSELSLIDPRSDNSHQFDVCGVFHCDGLLLCISYIFISRLVVWNPCTAQTRWIEAAWRGNDNYVLGYSKSSTKTYKVLSFFGLTRSSKIYDFNSDSWRVLDHDISPGWSHSNHLVSLKGNAYWFTTDEILTLPGIYLRRFDFTSEKSSLLARLPYQGSTFETASLSVVTDEKLSVLLQPEAYSTSKTEIWVTNKIDETKPVSWSKLLVLDLSPGLQISSGGTFLLDEEKKVALCCERWADLQNPTMDMDKIYCVGEGYKVTQVYLREDTMGSYGPAILNYVPSLVQLEATREEELSE